MCLRGQVSVSQRGTLTPIPARPSRGLRNRSGSGSERTAPPVQEKQCATAVGTRYPGRPVAQRLRPAQVVLCRVRLLAVVSAALRRSGHVRNIWEWNPPWLLAALAALAHVTSTNALWWRSVLRVHSADRQLGVHREDYSGVRTEPATRGPSPCEATALNESHTRRGGPSRRRRSEMARGPRAPTVHRTLAQPYDGPGGRR